MGDNQNQTESQFKCRYKESGDNIVKVVFYAIVVSVLASAYLSIAGNNIVYITSLGDLWHKVTHAANCKKCLFIMVPLAYFLFFTGYFYDEWRRSSNNKIRAPRCCEVLDLLAWCCFTIQVVFLMVPSVSALLGIAGCTLASWSLLRLNDWSSIRSIKFWKWPETQQWIAQNVIWIVALSILVMAGPWSYVVIMASALGIFVYKAIIWLVNK